MDKFPTSVGEAWVRAVVEEDESIAPQIQSLGRGSSTERKRKKRSENGDIKILTKMVSNVSVDLAQVQEQV